MSYSANRTKLGSTISPRRIVFQSRPWNFKSPPLVGGLLSSSWSACCVREGCLDARGEPGVPRICSAKLPRWERGSGLEAIFSAGGGGERPMEAVELLRDCSGEGMWPSFLVASALSAIVGGRCGVFGKVRSSVVMGVAVRCSRRRSNNEVEEKRS